MIAPTERITEAYLELIEAISQGQDEDAITAHQGLTANLLLSMALYAMNIPRPDFESQIQHQNPD